MRAGFSTLFIALKMPSCSQVAAYVKRQHQLGLHHSVCFMRADLGAHSPKSNKTVDRTSRFPAISWKIPRGFGLETREGRIFLGVYVCPQQGCLRVHSPKQSLPAGEQIMIVWRSAVIPGGLQSAIWRLVTLFRNKLTDVQNLE